MNRIYTAVLMMALCTMAQAQTEPKNKTHEHSNTDANEPQTENILQEVTVEGIAGTQRMQDASIPFTVISPKTLFQLPTVNIAADISHQPGLAVISTGAGIGKPVIRGLGFNRVVVVEQGIRQEGQQWGNEHGLEVDAEGVHSVEVLKGPASLMYGSDAIAGVMVLHPARPLESNTMQVKVGGEYHSNNGLYNYHAGFAGNAGGLLWDWHFSDKAAHAYKNDRDGYVPGSWFKERDVQGMLGLNRQWGHSWLRFSHVNFTPGIVEGERYGLEAGDKAGELVWPEGADEKSYSRQLPYQRVAHTKVVTDNAWFLGDGGTLKAIIGYQQNRRREFADEMETPELEMMLRTVNYDIKHQQRFGNGWKMVAGIGGMWQSNENRAEECLIPDYRLFDFGIYATTEKKVGQWNLSGGLRFDNRTLWSDEGAEDEEHQFEKLNKNFNGVTGSVGAVWNVNQRTNLRVNVARGFRAPTVSELASNGVHEGSVQYEIGNGNLKSEYSWQGDLGMDYTSRYVDVQASLFVNRIDNYIFLSKLAGVYTEGYQTYQHLQGDARLMGGEVTVGVHPIRQLHINNSFSYVRGIQLHQPEESHNLPLMPAPRWNCDIRYDLPEFANGHCRRPYVGVGVEYNLRQDNYYALDGTETATSDYGIINLSAGIDLHLKGHNCIELGLVCQNLLDKVYQPHLSRLKYTDVNAVTGRQGVSAMGRNICVKVNIPIDIHLRGRE